MTACAHPRQFTNCSEFFPLIKQFKGKRSGLEVRDSCFFSLKNMFFLSQVQMYLYVRNLQMILR